MSERLNTSVDHISIVTDTARAIITGADGRLGGILEALPSELMADFTQEEGSDTEQASALYAATHLRTIIDLVELQRPTDFSHQAIAESFVHAYDRTYGLQSWDWVKTFVRTTLPSQFERLYEPTLTRLSRLASATRREGQVPQITPWLRGLAPVIMGRTPRERGEATAASTSAERGAKKFYDTVVGEEAFSRNIPPTN